MYSKLLQNKPHAATESNKRLLVVFCFFILFAIAIVIRLFVLQIINHQYYLSLAEDQHEILKKLTPERGQILAHNNGSDFSDLAPLAINRDSYLVYAVPKLLQNPDETLKQLETILPFSWLKNITNTDSIKKQIAVEERARLLARLSKINDPYEPILHKVEDEQIQKLQALDLQGIKWSKEKTRFYPESELAAQILGFVNQDNQGAYGLEAYYNKELAGSSGLLRAELGNLGNLITLGSRDIVPAENGANLVLTIDKNIQYFAQKTLETALKEYEAASGSIIIMQPQTDKILAMCNAPNFNPNKYGQTADVKLFANPAVSIAYEPGSVMKPLTLSAAMQESAIDPFTTYQDPGQIKIADYTIYNYDKKSHGIRTMTQVLEESLNTGAVFAGRKIGIEKFTQYVKAFGLGAKTKIDLFGEAAGDISSLKKKHELYMATASFGQGIMVTPLQILNVYAAILNGGKMMRPYIVEEFRYDNKPAKIIQPQIVSRPVSEDTAKKNASMLVSVVENGHAKAAKIKGYSVGGKTGTAQVADPETGQYHSDKVIHTFIGFAPLNNPRFVMIVKIDYPKLKYAESTAIPTFTKIAKFILDYYAVEPEIK